MSIPSMFPAEIDRFRLIQLIVRWARETYRWENGSIGIKQDKLAERARSTQGSISHLENLEQAAKDPPDSGLSESAKRRRPGRRDMLQILGWGLLLPHTDVDALLWLYGEPMLSPLDISHYFAAHDPEARARTYNKEDYDELRGRVIALLFKVRDHLVESSSNNGDFHHADVKMLFERNEEDHIRSDEELLRVEEVSGQRMMLMKHLSFLTFPKDAIESGKVDERPLSETGRTRTHKLSMQRVDILLQHLKLYGERAIHRKASLKRYLTVRCASHWPFEERRKQAENCIELLKKYPHYCIGLYDNTPELEFTIKSTVKVVMRGTSHDDRYYNQEEPLQKNVLIPRYIHWTDKLSVLSYYLMFETYWDAITIEDRTKNRVIEQLQQWMQ